MNKIIKEFFTARYILLAFALIAISVQGFAQEDLFGPKKDNPGTVGKSHSGVLIGINGNLDFPGGDMAKRFGTSYRIGPSVLFKTQKNWIIGVKTDFILGNRIKEDSLMANIRDFTGNMLNQDGSRISPTLSERGYMIGIQGGRIFNLKNSKNKDNGILLLGTFGFMQHKIKIQNNDQSIPQIRGQYLKGYDRLTNGAFAEVFAGYSYFGKDQVLNFNLGLDVAAGFTQGRRDYLFDVMRPDNAKRLDMLIGIRGTWYIPIFHRKSEEYVF